jgi:hypothetical protein
LRRRTDQRAHGALHAHFSKNLLNFKNELSATKKSVDSLQLEPTPLQKSSFYPDFREQAAEAHQELLDAIGAFNDQVLKLSASMARKLASTFEGMEFPELSDEPERNLARRVAANNAIGESFGKLKVAAEKKSETAFRRRVFRRRTRLGRGKASRSACLASRKDGEDRKSVENRKSGVGSANQLRAKRPREDKRPNLESTWERRAPHRGDQGRGVGPVPARSPRGDREKP